MISDYLAHCRPKQGMPRLRDWSVADIADDSGWYRLSRRGDDGPAAVFRLPSGADVLAVEGQPHAGNALAQRCTRSATPPAHVRQRIEAAMEAMAPNLAGELGGLPVMRRRCDRAFRSAPLLSSGTARPGEVRL